MQTKRIQFELCWALAAVAFCCLVAAALRTLLALESTVQLALATTVVLATLLAGLCMLWAAARAARTTFRVIKAYVPVRRR